MCVQPILLRTKHAQILSILGITQGGGNSGCLWALISSIMSNKQMDNTPGAEFSPCIQNEVYNRMVKVLLTIPPYGFFAWLLLATSHYSDDEVLSSTMDKIVFCNQWNTQSTQVFWYKRAWQFTRIGVMKKSLTLTQQSNLPQDIIQFPNQFSTMKLQKDYEHEEFLSSWRERILINSTTK